MFCYMLGLDYGLDLVRVLFVDVVIGEEFVSYLVNYLCWV